MYVIDDDSSWYALLAVDTVNRVVWYAWRDVVYALRNPTKANSHVSWVSTEGFAPGPGIVILDPPMRAHAWVAIVDRIEEMIQAAETSRATLDTP
jgi:hypothetical protein